MKCRPIHNQRAQFDRAGAKKGHLDSQIASMFVSIGTLRYGTARYGGK